MILYSSSFLPRRMFSTTTIRTQYVYHFLSVDSISKYFGTYLSPPSLEQPNNLAVFILYSAYFLVTKSRTKQVGNHRLELFNVFALGVLCVLLLCNPYRASFIASCVSGRYSRHIPLILSMFLKSVQDYSFNNGLINHTVASRIERTAILDFLLCVMFNILVLLGLNTNHSANHPSESGKTVEITLTHVNLLEYLDFIKYLNNFGSSSFSTVLFGDTSRFNSLLVNHQTVSTLRNQVLQLYIMIANCNSASNNDHLADNILLDQLAAELKLVVTHIEVATVDIDPSHVRDTGIFIFGYNYLERLESGLTKFFTRVDGASITSNAMLMFSYLMLPTLSHAMVNNKTIPSGISNSDTVYDIAVPIVDVVTSLLDETCHAESNDTAHSPGGGKRTDTAAQQLTSEVPVTPQSLVVQPAVASKDDGAPDGKLSKGTSRGKGNSSRNPKVKAGKLHTLAGSNSPVTKSKTNNDTKNIVSKLVTKMNSKIGAKK
uniref:Uncharacterized protein n=1 Tax=viral metagenome TaxID=1070528 RepID=A0A2V0R9B8_9ZZZZ